MKKSNVSIGDVYGRLTVIYLAKREKKNNPNHMERVAGCACECGKETTVPMYRLKSGNTRSCGCLQRETVGNMSRKHGLSTSPEFNSWRGMIERCTNLNHKNYKHYGGRGIKVCQEWKESFEQFYSDMGSKPSSKHSIERINNDGGYNPGNCIWAEMSAQARNRRILCTNRSGVTGVGWNKSQQKWRARIGKDGAVIELGYFDKLEDAAAARKAAEALWLNS